jgi:hypothetical protein
MCPSRAHLPRPLRVTCCERRAIAVARWDANISGDLELHQRSPQPQGAGAIPVPPAAQVFQDFLTRGLASHHCQFNVAGG